MLIYNNDIDLNVVNQNGYNPLHWTVEQNNIEMVNFILESKRFNFDLNARTNDGSSYLHLAMKTKNKELLDLFENKGLTYNVRDKEGKTPLMILINLGSPIIHIWKDILNKQNLSINIQDKKGISFYYLTYGNHSLCCNEFKIKYIGVSF